MASLESQKIMNTKGQKNCKARASSSHGLVWEWDKNTNSWKNAQALGGGQ